MRLTLRNLAATAAIVIGAACGEPTSAPHAVSRPSASGRAPALDLSSYVWTGSATYSFVVSPTGGAYDVGGIYTLSFPANAVCDPSQSTYGPTEWDNPCVTLSQPITITATVVATTSGLAVDFQPALRFSPEAVVTISTDAWAPVILANADYFKQNISTLNPLAIYYIPSLDGARVADFKADPTVKTHISFGTGRVWRRIKHFSGYSVSSGLPCDPSPDNPDCVDNGDGK